MLGFTLCTHHITTITHTHKSYINGLFTLSFYLLKHSLCAVGDLTQVMEVVDAPVFSHPFTGIIAGPTKAGKTELAKRIVRNAGTLIFPSPEKIVWCFREFQPGYRDLMKLPSVELVEGMPDLEQLRADIKTRKLIVMDDMMEAMDKKNCGLTDIFTRGCHHWNVSVFHIVQNLFYGNIRTARINSHYIVLLRNPSDKLQAVQLAHQMYPGKV